MLSGLRTWIWSVGRIEKYYKHHKYHRFVDGDQWDAMLALEQRFDVWLKNRCYWSFNYVGYLFFKNWN